MKISHSKKRKEKGVKERPVATLTIHYAASMDFDHKKQVADWLVRKSKELISLGDNYSQLFTARFYGDN